MGLELRQQLKLSQQLVMTPQLQQAIKLLQLSRLELVETVQQELLENPFLEEAETERSDLPMEEMPVEVDQTTATPEMTSPERSEEMIRSTDWENYLGEFSSISKQAQVRETEIPEEGVSFEARLASKPSLDGHLSWQMRLSHFTQRELDIGEAVIGNLDSGGYLHADMDDIRAMVPDAADEEIEAVIHRIQRLDPVGVAARTPRECLLVQLEILGETDPILLSLVDEHLEDLEKKRYKPLARKFKIDMEELKHYLEIIQKLDPMPGANFSSTEPHYVSPDVFVYKYGDDFIIVLNEDGLPRLQLNTFFADSLSQTAGKEKDYVQEKMRSAAWLMKSLYQRQRTLYKVVESIVRFQREFFEYGVTKLKPLILKEVAEDIGMHESTVSRITTSKYVATPHGVFELKFFFNSALDLEDGTQVGSESVKALIKKLIGEEDPKHPLSDERIGEILKDHLKVDIARRTVAKYRSAMNIASSSKRKDIL
ncbi:MAG TPA: RNA polymerase factor sigma-54 [Desulfovibrio sp.]|jgi:RNA polymerase sigma-54 factor|uniref:RNA polymerase factor sigma-54 n=1 Tax=Desulfovibrio TaxID=872 RepID=UPI002A3ADF85|nr:RNA polymerase factor sigma-54 [Desulfovibrio sp.]MDY0306078.1 RNA polymerase factor sigma-54 [Desulfovibrionaceae bacterium]HMM38178.1 RNA polymerase factor sigma-54 [Desulfovibrio sp.]